MADNGKWLMFNLDGSSADSPKGISLERATQTYLVGASVVGSHSSPDSDDPKAIKWTSWRFSNGVDLRYEGSRITMWIPATNEGKCPTCTQPLPQPAEAGS